MHIILVGGFQTCVNYSCQGSLQEVGNVVAEEACHLIFFFFSSLCGYPGVSLTSVPNCTLSRVLQRS